MSRIQPAEDNIDSAKEQFELGSREFPGALRQLRQERLVHADDLRYIRHGILGQTSNIETGRGRLPERPPI